MPRLLALIATGIPRPRMPHGRMANQVPHRWLSPMHDRSTTPAGRSNPGAPPASHRCPGPCYRPGSACTLWLPPLPQVELSPGGARWNPCQAPWTLRDHNMSHLTVQKPGLSFNFWWLSFRIRTTIAGGRTFFTFTCIAAVESGSTSLTGCVSSGTLKTSSSNIPCNQVSNVFILPPHSAVRSAAARSFDTLFISSMVLSNTGHVYAEVIYLALCQAVFFCDVRTDLLRRQKIIFMVLVCSDGSFLYFSNSLLSITRLLELLDQVVAVRGY